MNQRSNLVTKAYEEVGVPQSALLERTFGVIGDMKTQGKLPPLTVPTTGMDYATAINLFVKNIAQKGRAKIIGESEKITIKDFFDKDKFGGMHGLFAQPHLYKGQRRGAEYSEKDITDLTLADIKDFSPQAMTEVFILSAMTQLLREKSAKDKTAPAPIVAAAPAATADVRITEPKAVTAPLTDAAIALPAAATSVATEWVEVGKILQRVGEQMPKREFRSDLAKLLSRYEKN